MNITLPEDVIKSIFRKYFDVHVLDELLRSGIVGISKWYDASDLLKTRASEDNGCIQHGYTEFDEFIEDHNIHMYTLWCVREKCISCETFKFPCMNCHYYAFDGQIPCELWNSNF